MKDLKMNNVDLVKLYDTYIEKYEGEIKGFQIMLRMEELSEHNNDVKKKNCEIWKKSIRKSKYNLTRTRNLKNKL